MRFKEFIAKLSPTLSKRSILSELDMIQDSIKTYTIPTLKRMEDVFGKSGFKSVEADAFETHFNKVIKTNNVFKTLTQVYNNCYDICEYLKNDIDEKFQSEDITRAALSMYMVNALRIVQVISFVADFGRRFNLYLINKELRVIVSEDSKLGKVTNAEEKFIASYKYQFMNACSKLNIDVKKLQKQLNDIPNILVDVDNIDNVIAVAGVTVADPMALNGFATKYNPFMAIGMRVATYQAAKYKQAQADLEEVQAKILYLKQQSNGKEDAKLEKQIEYYTDLNNKLKAQLVELGEDYGIND